MFKIREAALPMNTSHDNLRGQLSKALKKAHGLDEESWSPNGPYINDVFPSHVVYNYKGQLLKRKYKLKGEGEGQSVKVDDEAKPCHVAYMDSTFGPTQESVSCFLDSDEVTEKYISQATRNKMDSSDFAGKGTSFPIKTQKDVDDALHDIPRAGSDNYDAATLHANIARIAKRKGLKMPEDKESTVVTTDFKPTKTMLSDRAVQLEDGLTMVAESVGFEMAVREGKKADLPSTIPVKLIGPGWGSMAHYGEAMLRRDGPKVYKKQSMMFWNHDTDSQEAERPEGDLSRLAGILTEDAHYEDDGVKGPGLYSKAKIFSDYAQQVAEKGPHIGLSINAAIKHHEGTIEGRTGRIADEMVHGYSVDFVTKAGAKGAPIVPVTESQRAQIQNEGEPMTEAEKTALEARLKALESETQALRSENNRLKEGEFRGEAVRVVTTLLREAGIPFQHAIVNKLCENPTVKEGKLDQSFVDGIIEILVEGHGGRVTGNGANIRESLKRKPEDIAKDEAAEEADYKESMRKLGVTTDAGLAIATKGR